MNATKTLQLPVSDDYTPPAGELNNFVYLICTWIFVLEVCPPYTVGWAMRAADLQVCLMMVGGPVKGNDGLSKLCDVTCEYLWDHIFGEPEDASPEQFFEHVKPLLQEWYQKATPEERANTG